MGCATRIHRTDNHLSRAEKPATSTVDGLFRFRDSYHVGSARPAASMQSAVRDSALRPARPTVVLFPRREPTVDQPARQDAWNHARSDGLGSAPCGTSSKGQPDDSLTPDPSARPINSTHRPPPLRNSSAWRRTTWTAPTGRPSRSARGSFRIRLKASRSCSAAAAPSSPTTWGSARRGRRSCRSATPPPAGRTSSSAPPR